MSQYLYDIALPEDDEQPDEAQRRAVAYRQEQEDDRDQFEEDDYVRAFRRYL